MLIRLDIRAIPFVGPSARMKLLGRNLADSRFVIDPASVPALTGLFRLISYTVIIRILSLAVNAVDAVFSSRIMPV